VDRDRAAEAGEIDGRGVRAVVRGARVHEDRRGVGAHI
jgi:hypothetical protein